MDGWFIDRLIDDLDESCNLLATKSPRYHCTMLITFEGNDNAARFLVRVSLGYRRSLPV
jgi:hypothetical protein